VNRHRIVHPDGWPRASGYSNGISSRGRVVSVAGQVGWNPRNARFETDDFVKQARQALENVVAVLRAGSAAPEHLVRVRWYVVDREAYVAGRKALGAAWHEVMGEFYPAMTLVVVAGLLEPQALVEIEATAMVPE
jgi:enamine deaminase RidA (YjgF/YER057c/UK114 family)